jgi:hypothetical protein
MRTFAANERKAGIMGWERSGVRRRSRSLALAVTGLTGTMACSLAVGAVGGFVDLVADMRKHIPSP